MGATHLFKLIVRLYKSLPSLHGQFHLAVVSRGAVSGLINGSKSLESALVEAEDMKMCWFGVRKLATGQTRGNTSGDDRDGTFFLSMFIPTSNINL